MPSLWWVRVERVSSQPPISPLFAVWSLGCLSILQRIAEHLCPWEGPGALGIPSVPLSEPTSPWRAAPHASAWGCHGLCLLHPSLLGKVSSGLLGLALAGCGDQALCKHHLCGRREPGSCPQQDLASLSGFAPKLSHHVF